jgi:hypothetical protein
MPMHLYAALAAKERRLIAKRTKAALAAKSAAGASPGNPHNLDHTGCLGRAALARAADEFASSPIPVDQAIGLPARSRSHPWPWSYTQRHQICSWRQMAPVGPSPTRDGRCSPLEFALPATPIKRTSKQTWHLQMAWPITSAGASRISPLGFRGILALDLGNGISGLANDALVMTIRASSDI